MKVWLATTGDYSDYKVRGVYSTEEKAREAMLRFGEQSDYPPESFEIDAMPDRLPGNNLAWRVSMDKDGNVAHTQVIDLASEWDEFHVGTASAFMSGELEFECAARDREHAIKIVNEWRLQMIASGRWDEIVRGDQQDQRVP